MNITQLGNAISTLLAITVLAVVAFRFWPAQRIDLFRQQMFALRDELFDYAADENIGFDSAAYTLLRDLMNGFIRFAHNLTPYRVLMLLLQWKYFGKPSSSTWTQSYESAVNALGERRSTTQLNLFHSRAVKLVMAQLLLSPGVILIGVPLLGIVALLWAQWSTFQNIYADIRKAVPISLLEEAAARS